MGTELRMDVWACTRAAALASSEAGVRSIELVEARLSNWREDAELSRFNRNPLGQPFRLSDGLARDLGRALHWRDETHGAFNPVLDALVEAWALRDRGRRPAEEALHAALGACGADAIRFELPELATRLIPGSGLDSGGFGKGVALDEAAAALCESGATSALLDFGGQVLVVGSRWSEAPARIDLAHPLERQHPVVRLELASGSAATSGNSEQTRIVDGERIGHILDPRTGRPAPDFGSLTVWARGATDADCLSTGLFVLGPDAALQFAQEHSGVEVLVLEPDEKRLRARVSAGLKGRLTALDPRVALEDGRGPH